MPVRPVLLYPDARLTTPCEPVVRFDRELERLAEDLVDTLAGFPGAIGIAAPQIGRLLRVTLVDVTPQAERKNQPHHGRLLLVNPRLTRRQGEVVFREGCLSLPQYTGNVRRAERVRIEAFGLRGESLELDAVGMEAICLQHEIDHLDGVLFIHRVSDLKTDVFRRKRFPRPPST